MTGLTLNHPAGDDDAPAANERTHANAWVLFLFCKRMYSVARDTREGSRADLLIVRHPELRLCARAGLHTGSRGSRRLSTPV